MVQQSKNGGSYRCKSSRAQNSPGFHRDDFRVSCWYSSERTLDQAFFNGYPSALISSS